MTAATFLVRLPQFTGTLEELVLAVHRGTVSLTDLPLGALAQQLLEFLRQPGARASLDRPMEWAELAARLIRWKSLTLLPAGAAAHTAVAAAELRQEIAEQFQEIERARVERLRDFLAERLVALGGSIEAPPQIGAFLPEEPALFPSLWTLRKKFQTLRQRAQQHREVRLLIYQFQRNAVPVEEMIGWLEARLAHLPAGEWTPAAPLFAEAGGLPRQVTLFQAMLELARHSLALEQTGEFAFSLSKRVSNSPATEI
jgi:chromatin segregation and condensation protein Rec8/ScpA/Scc1 (kleisin family)